MTRRRFLVSAGAVGLLFWLITPQLFHEFAPIREKVVQRTLPADAELLQVSIAPKAGLENLRSPFALISVVRNDGPSPLLIRVTLDDESLCSARIAPGKSRRLDCAVTGPWRGDASHTVSFSGDSSTYALTYLELATHFGALSPGPRNLIIGPVGFSASAVPPVWHFAVILALLTLSVWSVRGRRLPRLISVAHVALTGVVGIVLAIVAGSRLVSPYSVLISDTFLEQLLLLTALPVLGSSAYALLTMPARPRVSPVTHAIGAGLVVGAIFFSFVEYQVTVEFRGNASGLVRISPRFFDKDPAVAERDDLRNALVFSETGGYDGQFFYLMAFDPFLTMLRERPRGYTTFFDGPPYRYGRIGFSILTKAFSLNRPERYPITMVGLVVVSLALCGALLGLAAHHHGFRPWYGVVIALIPGFWQSAALSLPEPVAVAFLLAAYLCSIHKKWWACGVLLGLSMLVRETGGALVLAVVATVFATGQRRSGLIVGLLAFLPVLLWKGYVGWVFWPINGLVAFMPHPNDVGLPFAGIWDMWTAIARGHYGGWNSVRAGLLYPLLTAAGAALAATLAVKQPSPIALAAIFYLGLMVSFNHEAVWSTPGSAHRLTADLFVALALVFLHTPPDWRPLRWAVALFWCACACYVLFGTPEAYLIRTSLLHWFAAS